ncbi:hypothetical protein, partial [Pantoea vagans]|uniref:hypothetical protein n=1 Tax=Pantoea vagans TaxID=470934 RepID=UPI0019554292
ILCCVKSLPLAVMMPAMPAAVMPAAAMTSVDNAPAQHRDNGKNGGNFNDFFHRKFSSFPIGTTLRRNSGVMMQ